MKRQFKEIQDKLQKKEEELKSFLHTQFEALKLKNSQLEEALRELSKKNEEIRIDNKKIQEENDNLQRNNKLFEDEKEQYEKNEIQRKILIKKLKNQLKLSLAVQNVDRQNLSTLMNSNVNVAQSIKQLMDIMKESKDILAEEKEAETMPNSKPPRPESSFEAWVSNGKKQR
ncbi:predicted protein [Naegleria gruberi]|uniref:Predicted protein n=1 Tax=Naegleria gruberi TaxID=5762 RepID=D2VSD7_NAEGR|nr:uncharacterized protein NAEGRDRAFT_71904 [Naegleria gruberi]EFC40328.1 predicted protein [Naegleria gruberi]|eukprot:XP_002673072.1 predicted protein [Naegleria gruberi strain NEG-M]